MSFIATKIEITSLKKGVLIASFVFRKQALHTDVPVQNRPAIVAL